MTEEKKEELRHIHVKAFEWDKGELSKKMQEVKHLITFDFNKEGKVVNIRLQK
jgi:hypothetical protein